MGQKVTHCTVGHCEVGSFGTSFIRFYQSLSRMGQNDTKIEKTIEIYMNFAGFYKALERYIPISHSSCIMMKNSNNI